MSEQNSIVSPDASFCTFRADDRLFGISVASLREISTNTMITRVPQSPPAVRGLVNLRSRVCLVIDLHPLLGLKAVECTPTSRLIILKSSVAEDVGFLVDHGGDILRVSREQIESCDGSSIVRDSSGDGTSPMVVAVCKLDRELLMIIDAARLVDAVSRAIR